MQFQVPQFIEVEDKIFGPLTIKQFVYLAGAAGMCFVALRFLNLYIGILVSLPIAALGLALAFYKANERQPFIVVLENMVKFYTNTKLYIWKKEQRKVEPNTEQPTNDESLLYIPKLSDSKLKDMTWNLDVASREYNNK